MDSAGFFPKQLSQASNRFSAGDALSGAVNAPDVMDCQEADSVPVPQPDSLPHPGPVSTSAVAQKRVVFDCLLLEEKTPVQALLDEQGRGGDDLVLVQEPEGLLQDSLTLRVSLTEQGTLRRDPGRLFNQDAAPAPAPLCLVLDCRNLTGAQLTAYNDLFDPDQPSLYDRFSNSKQPLGSHVRLLVLLSPQQYQTGTDADHAPGMDFWRRIVRPGLTLEWLAPSVEQDLLPPCHTGELSCEDRAAVIDFHLLGDWRRTLYGWMTTDDQGRMRFFAGALGKLSPGQRVILRGADWSDPVFCHEWLKIQRSGLYESNGCQCRLPGGLTFMRRMLDAEERQRLGRCLLRQDAPVPGAIVVNKHSLHAWLAQGCVTEDGHWRQADALQERLDSGAGLIVSAPLGEAGWLQLLSRLYSANRGAAGIGVFVAHDDPDDLAVVPQLAAHQQPAAAEAMEQATLARVLTPQVRIRSWQDADQITAWLEQQQSSGVPPQVIRVHPGTRLGVLFDDLHVLSEQRPLFGLRQTPLEQALIQGQPVVIRGLETNSELQWQLESLLCQTPSVLINGRWRCFPAADVTLLWPDSRESPSPLWSQALAAAEPLAAVDHWDALRARWQLDEDLAVQLRQAVTGLLRAWASVPSSLASQAGAIPVVTASLLDNLVAAAVQQARQEGAARVAPHHWRRAIDSLLSHRSRHCPPVRDFLKAVSLRLWPDPGPADWVDPDRLAAVMPEQGVLDRAFLKKQWWTLMRALGPGWQAALPLQFHPVCSDADLSRLVAVLRVWGAGACQQVSVEKGLEPDAALLERLRQAPVRCGQRLKRLGDALAAGWRRRDGCQDSYPALLDLAAASYRLASQAQEPAQAEVQRRLQALLQWEGAAGIEAAARAALARDLLRGGTDQADRRQRRLARLRQRLEQTPVLMVEGQTATGKSHFSAEVARQAGPTWVVSVGPGTTERDLVQRWVWRDCGQDRSMVARDQLLMAWAKTRPSSDQQLVTLVIDEANLAVPGVLDSIKGLWNRPPCVYIKGQPLEVSDRHRVILTGNPAGYAGRRSDPDLARLAQQVHFPPLDDDFLCQQLVLPAVQRHLARRVSPVLLQGTAATLMRVWRLCQPLLPERAFTPRDLGDLCAWLGWYVNQPEVVPLTAAGLNALVLQATADLLEGECDQGGLLALRALEAWVAARVPVDRRYVDCCGGGRSAWLDSQFVHYARQEAPDFATSPPAVMALISALNRDLDRCFQMRKGRLAAGRRQATLIEGPPGRGKDASLRLLLNFWKRHCLQDGEVMPMLEPLCASDCPWESLCEALRQARTQGQILVISELNLVESQYLEGELNASLAGEAAPGFHLFATINPPDAGCSGRHRLSPALLGRFRRLVIPDYSHDERVAIAQQSAAGRVEEAQVRQLAVWHTQLCQMAHSKGVGLRPANQSLMQLVRACQDCAAPEIPALFDDHYKMYLRAVSCDRAALAAAVATDEPGDRPHRELTHWINRCEWLNRPLTVWTGPIERLDWNTGRLVLPSELSDQQARERLACELIKERWRQETGLPASLDGSPGLEALLYLRLQQRWCQKLPEQDQVRALALFRLSRAGQMTLNMACNRAWVQGLDALCQPWPQHPWQWQSLWSRIQALCWQSGGGTQPEGLPARGTVRVDGETDENARPPAEVVLPGTFGTDHDDRLSRLAILEPVVVDGCLCVEPVLPGRRGWELLLPDPISFDAGGVLDKDQRYGVHPLADRGDWRILPGVDAADRLVQLRTDPPRMTEVIRDCETGLHYVRFLDASARSDVRVWVHFVLERSRAHERRLAPSVLPGIHPDACCDPVLLQRLDAVLAADKRACFPPATALALKKVTDAGSDAERVEAICRYCCNFKADRAPEPGEDLLEFLVRERQGSCRHRALVFVLLCRRWGIAARIVKGCRHQFGEYSLDAGCSWATHDLGGSYGLIRQQRPEAFMAPRSGSLSVQNFVRGLSLADQSVLLANLKAADGIQLAVDFLRMDKSQFEPVAVPETELSVDQACRLSEEALLGSLWGSRVMEDFVLGCRFLKGLHRPTEAALRVLADVSVCRSFLSLAVFKWSLHSSDVQMQLKQQLTQLGVWARQRGEYQRWRNMVYWLLWELRIKAVSDPEDFPAQAEDMLCWLLQRDELKLDVEHFSSLDLNMKNSLERLASMGRYRSMALPQLQCWYNSFFRLSFPAGRFEVDMQPMAGGIAFRTWKPSCYGGRLRRLEAQLLAYETGEGWTDQPEGVPDVERLLMQRPAFRTNRCVMTRRRRLVVLSPPYWNGHTLSSYAARLLDRVAPGLGRNTQLRETCCLLIMWSFLCCVYETGCQKGERPLVQKTWSREREWSPCVSSGLMSVQSLEQLVSALLVCPQGMHVCRHLSDEEACIQAACNAPDALVLSPDLLEVLLGEFLDTMDTEAFVREMGPVLQEQMGV